MVKVLISSDIAVWKIHAPLKPYTQTVLKSENS